MFIWLWNSPNWVNYQREIAAGTLDVREPKCLSRLLIKSWGITKRTVSKKLLLAWFIISFMCCWRLSLLVSRSQRTVKGIKCWHLTFLNHCYVHICCTLATCFTSGGRGNVKLYLWQKSWHFQPFFGDTTRCVKLQHDVFLTGRISTARGRHNIYKET